MNNKLLLEIKREYGHWWCYRTIYLVDYISTLLNSLEVKLDQLYTFHKDRLINFLIETIKIYKTPLYYPDKLKKAFGRVLRTLNRGNKHKKRITVVFTKISDILQSF